MARPPVLETRDVSVTRGKRCLLTGISFSVEPGQRWGILGPNGAGKSTLLKAMAGILPYAGEIHIEGRESRQLPAAVRATRCAYVPQHSSLEAPLTVREVVAQGRFAHQGFFHPVHPEDPSIIDAALEKTGALALQHRAFNRLSYGERRLVLVARSLATQAPVLLLDEPTAALDILHSLSILQVLSEVSKQGPAVILALHSLDEAARFCSHAILLQAGRTAFQGAVNQVIAPNPVSQVFGVELIPQSGFGYRPKAGATS